MIMARKKTHEEFIKQVFDLVGSEYEVLDVYINSYTKIPIKHNCANCNNHIFFIQPSHFVNDSTRCPECSFIKKRNTTKQFKEKVFSLVGNEYEVLGEYKNKKTNVKFKHVKCNTEFMKTPDTFIQGRRCKKCSYEHLANKFKKNEEQFKNEVFNLVGDEYTVLGKYINSNSKILIKHNFVDCNNYEYETRPSQFLRGDRCPSCCGHIIKTDEEFKTEVFNLVGEEYSILEEYISSKKRILINHNLCNSSYRVSPQNFLRGRRCPKCSRAKASIKKTKPEQSFKEEILKLVGSEYELIGNYINRRTKVTMRHNCEKCNFSEYEVRPYRFLGDKGKIGSRCTICNQSKGEILIRDYLNCNEVAFKSQFRIKECRDKRILPFDFAIFDKNNILFCLIEFQGEQHYKPVKWFGGVKKFESLQKRDNIKKEYCKNNGIKLIVIPYWERNSINSILEEKLFSKDVLA
jgi:hypothetical protein